MLKIIKIITHIIILYSIFLVGNWIQQKLDLLIPGSVIGMIILFLLLLSNLIKVSWIEEGTKFMIRHLTLFFIPVTVGVISYFELFRGRGFLLVVIVILSTLLVMVSSGWISQWIVTRKEINHD
ncbi:CidA/LrgA family protein [Oceanobacillus halophilus]|uniref:CidA/LrgA family holin-like protein n=1 Tax=Oceanobacillus halophilus TaxID=930130 RepID=A0A495A288_9BACI|nr:CidA/LrgA family holin-like protein [Oceanobacillus halophilus]RKQ33531.1 CidA/LrgA family holin-like protein [Oceanobacillus halophilus]